ncbi:hypothetical protein A0H81_02712 [Grifola frondosa]|uniref:C2H2-type domain-containing protein n=1 Tax=Grifola frondosa TaxID=5627 RepID=A0A1C7MMW9_GRIFR|nr:hypothetical protein A0H81_02712 [Grifola frondosa]
MQYSALRGTSPRARPDELEGLLADTSDADAETLSLHSNLGDDRRRRKRRRPHKIIRFFGFDLFGRPPIHLPESDDEGGRSRTISSSTLDSDASPLDASVIEQLSAARAAAAAAAEEEALRVKEDRRRQRRERKELKRAALAMSLNMQATQGEQFEGFQGSGSAHPPFRHAVPPGSCDQFIEQDGENMYRCNTCQKRFVTIPYTEKHIVNKHPELLRHLEEILHSNNSAFSSGSMSATDSLEFGPFAQVQGELDADADADADGADFGAESYTRPKSHSASTGTGTSSTSDSRSRTSDSRSYHSNGDPTRYNHHYLSQQSQPHPPSPLSPKPKSKRKSSKSKSTSSTSQSPSLRSPPLSDVASPRVFAHASAHLLPGIPDAETDEHFEGFPGEIVPPTPKREDSPSVAAEAFPSVGLRGVQRTKSDMGVFLARRGDE